MASLSRSRSKVRDRATVPENSTATHRMPATASGPMVASCPEMKAKENTKTTSAAMNPMVYRTSRLRPSMRRSLPATSRAWANQLGLATGGLLVDRANLVGGEPVASFIECHPASSQDDHLVGHRSGGRQIVGH
jgi:hypothetical protein